MNETIEMLEFIYKTADMGSNSSSDLMMALKDKDNKIKKELESINKKYEYFKNESFKLLKKQKQDPQTAGLMANVMSKMSIKKEVQKDNSDSSMADMLIQGLNMGNLDIEKRISNFEKQIDKKVLNLAKEFKKFGEDYIEILKSYL